MKMNPEKSVCYRQVWAALCAAAAAFAVYACSGDDGGGDGGTGGPTTPTNPGDTTSDAGTGAAPDTSILNATNLQGAWFTTDASGKLASGVIFGSDGKFTAGTVVPGANISVVSITGSFAADGTKITFTVETVNDVCGIKNREMPHPAEEMVCGATLKPPALTLLDCRLSQQTTGKAQTIYSKQQAVTEMPVLVGAAECADLDLDSAVPTEGVEGTAPDGGAEGVEGAAEGDEGKPEGGEGGAEGVEGTVEGVEGTPPEGLEAGSEGVEGEPPHVCDPATDVGVFGKITLGPGVVMPSGATIRLMRTPCYEINNPQCFQADKTAFIDLEAPGDFCFVAPMVDTGDLAQGTLMAYVPDDGNLNSVAAPGDFVSAYYFYDVAKSGTVKDVNIELRVFDDVYATISGTLEIGGGLLHDPAAGKALVAHFNCQAIDDILTGKCGGASSDYFSTVILDAIGPFSLLAHIGAKGLLVGYSDENDNGIDNKDPTGDFYGVANDGKPFEVKKGGAQNVKIVLNGKF